MKLKLIIAIISFLILLESCASFKNPGFLVSIYDDAFQQKKSFIRYPIKDKQIIYNFEKNKWNKFGYKVSPFNTKRMFFSSHILFYCGAGTKIFACQSGKIIHYGWMKGGLGGRTLIIKNGNFQYIYCHVDKLKSIYVGKKIKLNEEIGSVSLCGCALGPRLSFGLKYKGYYLNPLFFIRK